MEVKYIEDIENEELENLEEVEEVKEEFKITDLSSLEWALKKYKQTEENLEEQLAYIKEEEERIKAYKEKTKEEAESFKNYLKMKMDEYMQERTKEDPSYRAKTMSGSVSYGKWQKKIDYLDENKLMEELKEKDLSDFITVKTTESLNKRKINKLFKITDDNTVVDENGQIIENIKVKEFKNLNVNTK